MHGISTWRQTILLHSGIRHGHLAIVQFLLEELDYPIETTYLGLTPLQTALLYGRVEMADYLLSEDADSHAVTESRTWRSY